MFYTSGRAAIGDSAPLKNRQPESGFWGLSGSAEAFAVDRVVEEFPDDARAVKPSCSHHGDGSGLGAHTTRIAGR